MVVSSNSSFKRNWISEVLTVVSVLTVYTESQDNILKACPSYYFLLYLCLLFQLTSLWGDFNDIDRNDRVGQFPLCPPDPHGLHPLLKSLGRRHPISAHDGVHSRSIRDIWRQNLNFVPILVFFCLFGFFHDCLTCEVARASWRLNLRWWIGLVTNSIIVCCLLIVKDQCK